MEPGHFHEGEIAVQERLGIAKVVAQRTAGFIRSAMPKQHRDFFEMLQFVVTGFTDNDGHPWIVPVFGDPGFITSPDPQTLTIARQPNMACELGVQLAIGQKVGLLGIQLSTRRRNRMNGRISHLDEDGFTLHVDQSFGNCPQYIQSRDIAPFQKTDETDAHVIWSEQCLSDDARHIIEQSDTFFIASRSSTLSDDVRDGVDASHRGGRPGFVKIDRDGALVFPDFSGNRFFNTLGNIVADGRVGLWFPDFDKGDAVYIAGHAEIIWDINEVEKFEGAERLVRVQVDRTAFARQSMPFGGALIQASPSLKRTGTWAEAT